MMELGIPGLIIVSLFALVLIRNNHARGRRQYGDLLPALCGFACYGFFQYFAFRQATISGIDMDIVAAHSRSRGAFLLGFGCILSILGIMLRLLAQRGGLEHLAIEGVVGRPLRAAGESRVAFWICYLVLSLVLSGFLFPLGDSTFACFVIGSYVLTTLAALIFRRRLSTVLSAVGLAVTGVLLTFVFVFLSSHL
jgi:hypothetical protein